MSAWATILPAPGKARATLAVLLVLLGGAACTYSPSPADGALLCSTDDKCPDGYECLNNRCFRRGGGGGGGNGGSLQQRYLGTWVFTADSSIDTVCSTESRSDTMEGEVVQFAVDPSGQGDIQTLYPCVLSLSLDASSGTSLSDSTPYCSSTQQSYTYTWTAVSFDFYASSNTMATLDSDYDVDITDASQALVDVCTQRVRGKLVKQSGSALTAAPDPTAAFLPALRRRLP